MRTTLDVDDDVLLAAKERARREGRGVGAVLSELARQALTGSPPERSGKGRHGFRPLPSRGPVVSNAVIDALREDEGE
ncbi:MAG: CopG family transcriptional regulator [Acidimicrobiales bacterium]